MSIQKTAQALADAFETRTRNNGDEFRCLAANAPEWMNDAVQEAHGDLMPNDVSFDMVANAAGWIAGIDDRQDRYDACHEYASSCVSVYHSDRIAWLASHAHRIEYCDEAQGEGLVNDCASLSDRIAAGWYMEAQAVFNAIYDACEGEAA